LHGAQRGAAAAPPAGLNRAQLHTHLLRLDRLQALQNVSGAAAGSLHISAGCQSATLTELRHHKLVKAARVAGDAVLRARV
jgi:hypothetical protein